MAMVSIEFCVSMLSGSRYAKSCEFLYIKVNAIAYRGQVVQEWDRGGSRGGYNRGGLGV